MSVLENALKADNDLQRKKTLTTTKDVLEQSVFFARSFSQGSVCLKKIPLSLRTLFRKTSVQLPDMETLLCGILR